MRLALLKAPLPGLRHQLAHRLGTAIDHSPHSHSNIVFSNGLSGSSWAGEGVQIKVVEYDLPRWDFYTLPKELEAQVHACFMRLRGMAYDRCGVLRFGIPLMKESKGMAFCHEIIAMAFRWLDAWRYGPGLLLARCIDQFGSMLCDGPWPTSYPIHPEVRKAGRA